MSLAPEAAAVAATRPPAATAVDERRAWQVSTATAAVIPAAAVLWFSFRSGGHAPGAPAAGFAALALLFALRALLAPTTIRSLSGPALGALAAFGALGVWALLSALWSHAPARAIPEALRLALYAAAFGTLAS